MELYLFVCVFIIMGALVIFGIFLGEPEMKTTIVSPNDALYYEATVTIEPLDDENDIQHYINICRAHNFTPGEGQGKKFDDVYNRTLNLVTELQRVGFIVKRYMIVAVLLDESFKLTSTRSIVIDNGMVPNG